MLSRRRWRPHVLTVVTGLALLHVPVGSRSQLEPEAKARRSSPTVFVGRVVGPDGAPAAGAVVVTSAGGQALTDAQGSFTLEVGLPAEAESIRVTAVMGSGTGSLVGSARVGALARWGTTPAGTLVLEHAAGCEPTWLPTFGQEPGVSHPVASNDYVSALAAFDDGSGPALYVGGGFTTAGGVVVNRIAKWDGTTWSALGNGMSGGYPSVLALAAFDDGSGPALYAGGEFTSAGGVVAQRIAKWDGTSWSALGSGMNERVGALTAFDDGSGPVLIAGGEFTTAGGVVATRIAKWDGTSWSALGSGMNAWVGALTVFDDSSGPALIAGGDFTTAGGVVATRIAKWDGTSWSALGSGMNDRVGALTVFNDGSGPTLIAGGDFSTAGGAATNRIAKWNGSSWSALGGGMNDRVRALTVFDDGSGPALYAGGKFTTAGGVVVNRIANWDGSSWWPLGSGLGGGSYPGVEALTVFDDGSSPALCAGGMFTTAGGKPAYQIASRSGSSWSALGTGMGGEYPIVTALTAFDDLGHPGLYAGGWFTSAGDVAASRIAKWNGSSWWPLGSGVSGGSYPRVNALAVFDDGSGPALYAGGSFTTAGGVTANRIARWDGASWSALGSGMDASVLALTVFDDGSGLALYAGGNFITAGVMTVRYIAKWNGIHWSPIGGGLDGAVYGLADFDDGDGPALYAGGAFATAGGVAVNHIAKWNGGYWSPVGGGLDGDVYALAVFDDGGGPALCVGGSFLLAGDLLALRVAKWDDSSWWALGVGMDDTVLALTVYDDGTGPTLYAGGKFTYVGVQAIDHIAKWKGSGWSALGSGVSDVVHALTVFDDGNGPALYAGGAFSTTPDSLDSYLAKWGGCASIPTPWTDLGFALPGATGAPLLLGTGDLTPSFAGSLTLSNAAPSALSILFISLTGTPSAFKCGTLMALPVALQLSLFTNPGGSIPLAWPTWPGGLSGLSLYFQYAIQDAGAVCGVALSNALRADVP